ncbi:unnamed protein product [Symbiodinium microadriaticum]|nr:unnamed protein product [Symbiodinium sp. KB8]CAE7200055.1 unnamed protein product [Symbiodinium microadriaticum]
MVHSILCLDPKGPRFLMAAPVCSSWVWINRATNKRSLVCPLGDTSNINVSQANKMVSRTMMCLVLVLWMNGNYILVARLGGQHTINTFLGAWKHWTAKLTSFYSNQTWVGGLYRKLTPYRREEMNQRREELGMGPCSVHEDGKVTGTPYLKSAQRLDRFELFYNNDGGGLNLGDTWDDDAWYVLTR